MANLLQQFDALVGKSINENLYNDVSDFRNLYNSKHPYSQSPGGPLKFDGTIPAGITPVQGQLGNTDFFGGNPYNGKEFTIGGTFAPIAQHTPSALAHFDVFAIAHWVRNIGQEFGILSRPGSDRSQNIAKGITFVATQFLLASLNPGDPNVGGVANQLYNPLSLALGAVPLIRTATTIGSPNAAAALSVDGTVYSTAGIIAPDRHLLMRQGIYKKAVDGTAVSHLDLPTIGFIGNTSKPGPGDNLTSPGIGFPTTIQAQVDQEGPLAPAVTFSNLPKNIYGPKTKYSDSPVSDLPSLELEKTKFPNRSFEDLHLSNLFVDGRIPGFGQPNDMQYTWIAKRNSAQGFSTAPSSWPSDVSVRLPFEGDNGMSLSIPDDQIYLPFSFQDLRDVTPAFLYFRAFLKEGMTETFTPEWQSERYYGRVDEVPTYQGTTRTISLGFDVVAWSPEDLPLMWVKLHKLQSMVYPSYDNTGFMKAGPMIRMRVGDLVCASKNNGIKKGLPGYINSLDFAYDDGIWNMKTDFKIPRKVSVTLGFNVVHDGNPGIYPFVTHTIGDAVDYIDSTDGTFGAMKTTIDQQGNIILDVKEGDIRGIVETINAPII